MAELVDLFHIKAAGKGEPPLSEQAYARLRADIIHGEIAPDEKLKIDSLQRRYAISNTPLREALNRLAGERLVVADERRGFRAAPVSLQDFRDLTEYRLVLEQGAISAAVAQGGDEWKAGVAAAFRRLEASEARLGEDRPSRHPEWIERHKDFHMALLSGCMSERLIAACSAVFDEAERYRHLASRRARPGRHTGDEHVRIMQAALDRDVQLASALLRSHVMRTSAHVLATFDQLAVGERGHLAE
jgi:GntR family transcriptional regulator, carbon starvation induced regulator